MKKNKTTFLGGLFLMVCCLAVAGLSNAQTNWGGWCYRDYSSSGTFTVPANCTELYIEAVGGGGGGGNADKPSTSVATRTGTGGGGGAYARKHVTSPSGNYTITIGAGGGPAAAGSATTVSGTGCNISAGGGQPGSSNINGTGTTGNGGDGGSATGGDDIFTGGRGGKVCDNRITTAGSAHDRVGSGAGGGAAGGNGNGGYQDQPQTSGSGLSISRPNAIGTVGAGGGGTANGLSTNYSPTTTWYKGGNGGQGLYGDSGWGDGSTGSWPGGGGGGARAHGGLFGDAFYGGFGANGFVRVWFYIEKAEPLTVNIENKSTTCPYTLEATASNYLFTNNLKWYNSSTESTVQVNPSINTSYSVTVTDAYSDASHTCQITSSNSISVNACTTCDATPGSISAGIWVCSTTDTACVISSTADASSSVTGDYLWQSSPDHSTWTTVSGNASQYTATATGYYRRGYAVSGCTTVYTDYVQVTRPSDIDPGTLKDGDNNIEKAVCAGAEVNVTLSNTYSGNVQWQTSTDKVNWTDVSTANTYTISISSATTTTYVRYLAKYSTSCDIPSNNIYTLTVKPLPVVKINGANPYNVTKCANAEIEVTVTGADSYEWENHSTDNPATFPASSDGNYVVTGTTDGCSSTATITITNNPLPTISATNATQNITYGDDIADVVISNNTESTVSLSPATLPAGLTYNSSTQTISGKPTTQGIYTITATATSNTTPACGTATQEIKITVGKKNLTVTYTGTDGDNTKVYDGYPLTLSYDKLTFTGLESTDHITSGVITTDGYKVGDYICNAGSFERMWATGTATPSGFGPTSVTQNYNVTFNVTLSITKRPLEITANSASKEYDATPLTPPAPGYSFTNGTSLATTDAAEIAVEGSQLCPGSSNSTVTTVVITHTDDNVDVTDCYNITKKTGTLTVTPMACPATKTFEGYDYPLVQVGNKCWFAENLRAAATDAVPYDNQSANTAKFGLLYNWSAALAGNGAIKTDPCNGEFVQGICPSGWAIPSAADFNELQSIASGVINLRSDDATYWLPEYLGTDAVNFDERGGGLFNAALNRFEELKTAAYFWTSESVLHAASFPDGVAHTYCDEYYCGEYIPKTISVNSKSSIRCVRKTKED